MEESAATNASRGSSGGALAASASPAADSDPRAACFPPSLVALLPPKTFPNIFFTFAPGAAFVSGASNRAPSGVSKYRSTAAPRAAAPSPSPSSSRRSAAIAASSTAARVTVVRRPSRWSPSNAASSSNGADGKLADASSSSTSSCTLGSYRCIGAASCPDGVGTNGARASASATPRSMSASDGSDRVASSANRFLARAGISRRRVRKWPRMNAGIVSRSTERFVSSTADSSSSSGRKNVGVKSAAATFRGASRSDGPASSSRDRRSPTRPSRVAPPSPSSPSSPSSSSSSSAAPVDDVAAAVAGYTSNIRNPRSVAILDGVPASPSGPALARCPNHLRCNSALRSAAASRRENSTPPGPVPVPPDRAAASASRRPAPEEGIANAPTSGCAAAAAPATEDASRTCTSARPSASTASALSPRGVTTAAPRGASARAASASSSSEDPTTGSIVHRSNFARRPARTAARRLHSRDRSSSDGSPFSPGVHRARRFDFNPHAGGTIRGISASSASSSTRAKFSAPVAASVSIRDVNAASASRSTQTSVARVSK